MKVLLITPPLLQTNTPYPATAALTAFLRGVPSVTEARQRDWSLNLLLKVFSRDGVDRILEGLREKYPSGKEIEAAKSVRHLLKNGAEYAASIDSVILFLQGKSPTLSHRIAARRFLPEGPRFKSLKNEERESGEDPLWMSFGTLGTTDRAKYLASLYLDDLADAIKEGLDSRFGFSRYAESLAASKPRFEPLKTALLAPPTLIDRWLEAMVAEEFGEINGGIPDVVGITAPFPGNVYSALRIGAVIKRDFPSVKILLGGGYANTELRDLEDPRVFDFVDYIILDDGERPLIQLVEYFKNGAIDDSGLVRTFLRKEGRVHFMNSALHHDLPQKELPTPTYDGLPLADYFDLAEMLNPMHRLWSDGRWNKLILAHGCYWKKCSFCDTSLDYIGRYDPMPAARIVDRMEQLIRETGETGFHFVDEAAPPALLSQMAREIIRRGLSLTWWGNIRFEKTFTAEVAELLARSGCIAVTGGLEVASDRLLKKMNKGVTVEQVARVTRAFSENGVMVHAYLMYGFPTQTAQETLDALERVRQLFLNGCLYSAFWHRFSVTVHSPVGKNPAEYGIKILPEPEVKLDPNGLRFSKNDLPFLDPVDCDHDSLGVGLRKALYNYMLGVGFEEDPRTWFDFKVPRPQVPQDLVERALR